jgi:hypothetical protein
MFWLATGEVSYTKLIATYAIIKEKSIEHMQVVAQETQPVL